MVPRSRRVPHGGVRGGDDPGDALAAARIIRSARAHDTAHAQARVEGKSGSGMSAESSPLLDVEHLTMRFGGLVALNDLSFQAREGEITAIIGPNGAGKTTLFNCLTGFYHPAVGRMQLHREGADPLLLERMETFRIAREGRVVRTFQTVRLFAGMSVVENLMVAQHTELMHASVFSLAGLVSLPGYRKAVRSALERARFWVERLGLADMADRPAGHLPYGMQRRLEIARPMCASPPLLFLDEPAAGLNAQ